MTTITYKGHTITSERTTVAGSRGNLQVVRGPMCNTGPGCAHWTTSIAAAKARINEAIEAAAYDAAHA